MNSKQRKGCAMILIRLLVQMPIYFYLMYQVFLRVNATEVMWLLFWIYVPLTVVAAIIASLWEAE